MVFNALSAFVDAVIGDEPVSAAISRPDRDTTFVQRYIITIVPRASIAPHAINDVRSREADRVRESIERDPTLGGRLPNGRANFVRAQRTGWPGEVKVVYLT